MGLERVTFRDVDPRSGKLATRFCPLALREAFLVSTEPREVCQDHTPTERVRGFFDGLLNLFRQSAP